MWSALSVWIAAVEKAETNGSLVEVRLSWGKDLLAVRHRRIDETLDLSDFKLPNIEDGSLLVAAGGKLLLPTGAPVPEGHALRLRLGKATLRIALVADDAPVVPRMPRARLASGAALVFAITNILVAAFMIEHRHSPEATASALPAIAPPPIALEVDELATPTEVIEPVSTTRPSEAVLETNTPVPRRVTPETFGIVALALAAPPTKSSAFDRPLDVSRINALFTPTIDQAAPALATRTSL